MNKDKISGILNISLLKRESFFGVPLLINTPNVGHVLYLTSFFTLKILIPSSLDQILVP